MKTLITLVVALLASAAVQAEEVEELTNAKIVAHFKATSYYSGKCKWDVQVERTGLETSDCQKMGELFGKSKAYTARLQDPSAGFTRTQSAEINRAMNTAMENWEFINMLTE